jgi:thiol-disulfide isomerase/thioredoxin
MALVVAAGVFVSGCASNETSGAVVIESDAATVTPITPVTPPATDTRVEVTVFDINDREPAPDISGLSLDGKPVALKDFLGEVVVLNTWASWCAPCEDELPIIIDVGENYSRDGVRILGINVQDKPADAKLFAKKLGINFESIVDADAKLLGALPGVPPRALPSTLIIDRNGNIGARIVGPVKPGVLEEILDGWLTPN